MKHFKIIFSFSTVSCFQAHLEVGKPAVNPWRSLLCISRGHKNADLTPESSLPKPDHPTTKEHQLSKNCPAQTYTPHRPPLFLPV